LKCLRYRGRVVIVGFAARGGKMEAVRANRILLKSAMVSLASIPRISISLTIARYMDM